MICSTSGRIHVGVSECPAGVLNRDEGFGFKSAGAIDVRDELRSISDNTSAPVPALMLGLR